MRFTQDELKLQLMGLCLFINELGDLLAESGVVINQDTISVSLCKDDFEYLQSTIKTLVLLVKKLASELEDKKLAKHHIEEIEKVGRILKFHGNEADVLASFIEEIKRSVETSNHGTNN